MMDPVVLASLAREREKGLVCGTGGGGNSTTADSAFAVVLGM